MALSVSSFPKFKHVYSTPWKYNKSCISCFKVHIIPNGYVCVHYTKSLDFLCFFLLKYDYIYFKGQ